MSYAIARSRDSNLEANRLFPEDRAVHDWYRFVLSFPPHLVRKYVAEFRLTYSSRVLDPFCGTGTTLVECKKLGIPSVGLEVNPMAHFASQVKADWSLDPDALMRHAKSVAEAAFQELASDGVPDTQVLVGADGHRPLKLLSPEQHKLLLTDSISALPLHKMLTLMAALEQRRDPRFWAHERLALAKALVFFASNLEFGPEVGVGPAKLDAPVVAPWLTSMRAMADDLRLLGSKAGVPVDVYHVDARKVGDVLAPRSVDAVITSPPYPNEKDYTRTTRLESVLLGFITDKPQLQELKKNLVRSNTRGVYKGDEDDRWVARHPEIQRIADAIEARRLELGKTSGFERLYARVTRLYFGGLARHLEALQPKLRPGAHLAYVVGDQASYLRVMIPTGELLASIAESLGYEKVRTDLHRTRRATATRAELREEVVVLRWPG